MGTRKSGGNRHGEEFNFGIEIDSHILDGIYSKMRISAVKRMVVTGRLITVSERNM